NIAASGSYGDSGASWSGAGQNGAGEHGSRTALDAPFSGIDTFGNELAGPHVKMSCDAVVTGGGRKGKHSEASEVPIAIRRRASWIGADSLRARHSTAVQVKFGISVPCNAT